eukprot:7655486-Heterocapsa_arctica.AAC.1
METNPALLWLLDCIEMRMFAQKLAAYGATEVYHIRCLSDVELVNTGMRLVQVRRLRAATGPPAPEAGISVQPTALTMSLWDHLPAGGYHEEHYEEAPASKSKRERVRRAEASLRTYSAETTAS